MEKQEVKAKEKSTKNFKLSRDDAIKALALERETSQEQQQEQQQEHNDGLLVLKFPDPEINEDIIKGFSSRIESVIFDKPITSRYCYVKLNTESNIDEVCKEISQITFGCVGKMIALPKKIVQTEELNNYDKNLSNIDPYALRIANLPKSVNIETLKNEFPTSKRINIDCNEKDICYALIHFKTLKDAIKSYEKALNMSIGSNKLSVKFKRQNDERNIKSSILERTKRKYDNVVDSKDNVFEEADRMRITNEESSSCSNTIIFELAEIKTENVSDTEGDGHEEEEDDDDDENTRDTTINQITGSEIETTGTSIQIKNEIINEINSDEDNDEIFNENDDCYEDEIESVSDDMIAFEMINEMNNDDTVINDQQQIENTTNNHNWKELYNLTNDKKPDINKIVIDIDKSKDSSNCQKQKLAIKRCNLYLLNDCSLEEMNRNDNVTKDTNQIPSIAKKKICYRDELDELFERINSEDDDFVF